VQVRALTAKQRFHAAGSVGVTITKVINMARRFPSFRARLRSRSYPRALNSFSCAGFSFCGHDSETEKSVNGGKRQSSFGRRGVNAGEQTKQKKSERCEERDGRDAALRRPVVLGLI